MYNLSIGAIFKNEGKYLKEWLDYHLLIGVEHFYLYCNNDDLIERNKCLEIISNYPGKITLFFWTNKTQFQAYSHLIEWTKNKSEWVAIIDLDEFIYCKKSIQLFLQELPLLNIGSLYCHWKNFGSSNRIYDGSTLSLYNRAKLSYHKNQNIKSIVRPKYCNQNRITNSHYFEHVFSYKCVNERETELIINEANWRPYPVVIDNICINHYPIRSEENLQMKLKRGYKGFPVNSDYLKRYKEIYDKNDEFDDSMKAYDDVIQEHKSA